MMRRNNKHDRKGRVQGHLPCISSPTALKPGKRKQSLRGWLREPTLPATPPLVHPSRQSTLCTFSALTPSPPSLHHVTMSTWGNWPSLDTVGGEREGAAYGEGRLVWVLSSGGAEGQRG